MGLLLKILGMSNKAPWAVLFSTLAKHIGALPNTHPLFKALKKRMKSVHSGTLRKKVATLMNEQDDDSQNIEPARKVKTKPGKAPTRRRPPPTRRRPPPTRRSALLSKDKNRNNRNNPEQKNGGITVVAVRKKNPQYSLLDSLHYEANEKRKETEDELAFLEENLQASADLALLCQGTCLENANKMAILSQEVDHVKHQQNNAKNACFMQKNIETMVTELKSLREVMNSVLKPARDSNPIMTPAVRNSSETRSLTSPSSPSAQSASMLDSPLRSNQDSTSSVDSFDGQSPVVCVEFDSKSSEQGRPKLSVVLRYSIGSN
jgi:hypothetical protein